MSNADYYMELTSRGFLIEYMEGRGLSVRGLAAECIVKDRKTGKRRPLSFSMIGALRSGRVKTVSPQTAFAIERALHAPPNVLFQPRVQRRQSAA